MIRLKEIKFCNIGRFVSEQTIDFTQFSNLLQIKGINKNTGGSSGASKSTIFNAIDYLLGINDIPTTALQSRLTKNAIYVEGTFDVDGTPLILARSKKDGVYLKFGDEEVSGNVKLAEERLEQIIGVPLKLFKKMVHKKQKEGGFFLNLTAKESYEFLMKSLNLETLIDNVAKIDLDIKSHLAKIAELEPVLVSVAKSIEDIRQLKSTEIEPICDIDVSSISILEERVNKHAKDILDINETRNKAVLDVVKPVKEPFIINGEDAKGLECELTSLKDKRTQILSGISQERKAKQSQLDALKTSLTAISYAKNKIPELVSEMKALMGQKAHIEANQCPTCSQSWVTESAKTKYEQINKSISDLKIQVLEKKGIVGNEETIKSEMSTVSSELSTIETTNYTSDVDSEIDNLNVKVQDLKSQQRTAASEMENEFLKQMAVYNEKVSQVKETYAGYLHDTNLHKLAAEKEFYTVKEKYINQQSNLKSYRSRMEGFEKVLASKQVELDTSSTTLLQEKQNLAVAEESKRLVKTYTLQIFQDTLDYIGSYATEILSSIPNMSNATIYFEGCKETQSGSIKDEVNAILNLDGHNDISIKTLSGGERTAIDLAVDLAVIDMIEAKTGKGADFYIMDEAMTGLEEVNIIQCIELLKQLDINKRIILVDHNPMVNEMIEEKIVVERDGEESYIL